MGDYDIGGEEYLTFAVTRSNLGGGMDAKSGVFTVPQAGAYMFTIHICTHDMKKGLLSLRCNGNELASSTTRTTTATTRTRWPDRVSLQSLLRETESRFTCTPTRA